MAQFGNVAEETDPVNHALNPQTCERERGNDVTGKGGRCSLKTCLLRRDFSLRGLWAGILGDAMGKLITARNDLAIADDRNTASFLEM